MRITEKLLRQKAEHNEGWLIDLEEIALHQMDIEKIENFDMLCRHIKILLLQNNLIEKMENLNKLKELEYLNLALNNITIVEGIENCESLNKLDLTCNFIGPENFVESLKNIKKCESLKEIYIMGNPCCDFPKHKELMIGICNNLVQIDGVKMLPSERIIAKQMLQQNLKDLEFYIKEQKSKVNSMTVQEKENQYTKESWIKMHKELKEQNKVKTSNKEENVQPRISSKLNKDGELWLCNEGKFDFELKEYEHEEMTYFTIRIPKHIDTDQIHVEILKEHVSIRVKTQLTQIKLWESVYENPKKLQWSQATGQLLIELIKIKKTFVPKIEDKKQLQKELLKTQMKQDEYQDTDDSMPELVD